MPIPPPLHGRGAPANPVSTRFNDPQRAEDGDWLDDRFAVDGEAPPLRTTVALERPKTIISRNTSPDIPFDRSVNAYRGCEHGCIYCFARPTHAYLGLSPGLDFESKLTAKPLAPQLLRAELSKRGYSPKPLAMGTNTDPYQPIEADYRITRGLLEVLLEFGHPVTITTKSDRVTQDLDLLVKACRARSCYGCDFGHLARPQDGPNARTPRRPPRSAASPPSRRCQTPACRPSCRSPPSSRPSPTTRSKPFWRPAPQPVPSAPSAARPPAP